MILTAKTTGGMVSGMISGIHTISAFKGVPYAAPPVGELRWKRPQPVQPWGGVRRCISLPPTPMQQKRDPNSKAAIEFYGQDFEVSEDCLYLNIWTPAKTAEEKLPVYFWIYGGAFVNGTTAAMQYDMENLAKQGIVVVTINYRVGIMGFLTHPELTAEDEMHVSGNYGLYDQVAALTWVRENIAAFGGDPDHITIGGQSAGAVSAHILACTPLTKGMIYGVVSQSGAGPIPPMKRPIEMLEDVQAMVDLEDMLGVKTIAEARALDGEEVIRRATAYKLKGGKVVFHENCDGYLLPETETVRALKGEMHACHYMMGGNADEGMVPYRTLENFERIAKEEFGSKAEEYLAIANVDIQAKVDTFFDDTRSNVQRLGAKGLALCLQQVPGAKAYLYHFAHKLPGDNRGAFHGGENWYAYGNMMKCWRPFKAEDYDLCMQMMGIWANFIKTGDPNGVDILGRPLPCWRPFTLEHPDTMILDLGMKDSAPMADHPVLEYEINYMVHEYLKEHKY